MLLNINTLFEKHIMCKYHNLLAIALNHDIGKLIILCIKNGQKYTSK